MNKDLEIEKIGKIGRIGKDRSNKHRKDTELYIKRKLDNKMSISPIPEWCHNRWKKDTNKDKCT